MSPELEGLIALTFFSLAGIALCGKVCLEAGRRAGFDDGLAYGHGEGWRDAHLRVASALGIPPENLNLALLERELAKVPRNDEQPPAARVALDELLTDDAMRMQVVITSDPDLVQRLSSAPHAELGGAIVGLLPDGVSI